MKRELPPADARPLDQCFTGSGEITDPEATRAALITLARLIQQARTQQTTAMDAVAQEADEVT